MLVTLCVAATALSGPASRAADVEAFEAQDVKTARPNVLFVLDSTESLGAAVTQPDYDPETTYDSTPANCDGALAYFHPTNPAVITDCSLKNKGKNVYGSIQVSKLYCDAATMEEFKSNGVIPSVRFVEKVVTVKGGKSTISFTPLNTVVQSTNDIYCESAPEVGSSGAPTEASFTGDPITLYHGNWLNYYGVLPTLPVNVTGEDRMTKIKDALLAVASKYQDRINIGLMRTSTSGARQTGGSGSGGMVVFPIKPMDVTAIYGAYHGDLALDGTPDAGDGKNNTLDDFIWTLRRRIACKQDENCDGAPPPPEKCKPNDPDAECIPVMQPNGSAKPLAELLFEAAMYFMGHHWKDSQPNGTGYVNYGTRSAVDPTIDFDSVDASTIDPDAPPGQRVYESPVNNQCQNNYIIMLTDGLSQQDSSSNSAIETLLETLPTTILQDGGYTGNQVQCTSDSWGANAKAPSECIDDLAFFLKNADFDNNPINGRQGARTYTIGFQLSGSSDEEDASALLSKIAEEGGTETAILADSAQALNVVLDGIVAKILSANTAFSAPSVTINAFNRTQNLNDLYMAVFRPEFTRKWEGNVKKFNIRPSDGEIIDQNEAEAVDTAKGFFKATSQSLWSSIVDGRLAPEGGAASVLPDPDARRIYTNTDDLAVEPLRDFATDLDPAVAQTMFGLTTTPIGDVPGEVSTLVEWLYGVDTYDEYPVGIDYLGNPDDGNGDKEETKRLMGDPLHSRPAVVVYGKGGDPNDAVVYITTNEGLLHALDAGTGVEKWSFMPQELLYRLDFLRNFTDVTSLADRTNPAFYGLDGTVRVLRIDKDNDGPIESDKGDRVYIFFGMRRGGSAYYAFDVTNVNFQDPENPALPKLMWRFELPDGAQSWSNPTVGADIRFNVKSFDYGTFDGFDNDDPENKYAIVIGGGYDPANDSLGFASDAKGNKLYILDAVTGKVVWSAGPTGGSETEDLELSRMTHSIVADVRVLDNSGDRFVDRMYAADLGGQVWRFDVRNGELASDLVEGGVMASVGGEDSLVDRRFYYAPDVAEVRCSGKSFFNVAIGSGDRENPVKDKVVDNTFYSFRDYLMRTPVRSSNYKDDCSGVTGAACFERIVDDGSTLVDATSVANPAVDATKSGWRLDLVAAGADGGEKSLAESRTFASKVFFTSYAPELTSLQDDPCGKRVGVNRLYVVNACNAAPVNNNDGNISVVSTADRAQVLAQGSIAPEVVFVFPSPEAGCVTRDCVPPPQCLIGLMSCGKGFANPPVRTFWQERGAE
jgi:type IV pilus assembly protein PilY1